jgi:hypothetical protein
MKIEYVKAALLGSASALGLNWIYDRKLLDRFAEDNETIFIPIQHELYKEAKNGFDVYPNHKLGDLDFMGEVLWLFNQFLHNSKKHTAELWQETFYNYFKEDGPYDGYIEAYGKDLLKRLNDNESTSVHTEFEDKQLIGPLFILAMYSYHNSINKVQDALDYAKVLTSYSGVNYFSDLLYYLIKDLENGVAKKDALKRNINYAPKSYQESLKKALELDDINEFISSYSGIACGLEQSFPLIYYIVAHSNNWEEALRLNATLGGASSARGIFISYLLNIVDGINVKYEKNLNKK